MPLTETQKRNLRKQVEGLYERIARLEAERDALRARLAEAKRLLGDALDVGSCDECIEDMCNPGICDCECHEQEYEFRQRVRAFLKREEAERDAGTKT